MGDAAELISPFTMSHFLHVEADMYINHSFVHLLLVSLTSSLSFQFIQESAVSIQSLTAQYK